MNNRKGKNELHEANAKGEKYHDSVSDIEPVIVRGVWGITIKPIVPRYKIRDNNEGYSSD